MIYLRRATIEDMDLLYRWANDPIVRHNSFNTDTIPYESHIAWFNKNMENPLVLQFILMDDQIPIGQIRLNISGADAEIGYSIAREFRGKGYGHLILRLLSDEIRKNHSEIKRLIAKVKPENQASNRLFEAEDYAIEYTCYCKELS